MYRYIYIYTHTLLFFLFFSVKLRNSWPDKWIIFYFLPLLNISGLNLLKTSSEGPQHMHIAKCINERLKPRILPTHRCGRKDSCCSLLPPWLMWGGKASRRSPAKRSGPKGPLNRQELICFLYCLQPVRSLTHWAITTVPLERPQTIMALCWEAFLHQERQTKSSPNLGLQNIERPWLLLQSSSDFTQNIPLLKNSIFGKPSKVWGSEHFPKLITKWFHQITKVSGYKWNAPYREAPAFFLTEL